MASTGTKRRPVAVVQLGARRHYAVPLALHRADLLAALVTDFYSPLRGGGGKLAFTAGGRPLAKALARHCAGLPPELIISCPFAGAAEIAGRYLLHGSLAERAAAWAIQKLARGLGKVRLPGDAAAYAFAGQAGPVFAVAQERGWRCLLDQNQLPPAKQAAIWSAAHARHPDWEPPPPAWQTQRRQEIAAREWATADVILCPAAPVAAALESHGVPQEKVRIAPYGLDLTRRPRRQKTAGKILRAVVLGDVSLLKGIPDLLSAWAEFLASGRVRLAVAGQIKDRRAEQRLRNSPGMEYLGLLPRTRVPALLAGADLAAIPSLAEGSSLVAYEAMAAGVAVLASDQAGCPAADGLGGRILPAGDGPAWRAALEEIISRPAVLDEWGAAGRAFAEANLSIDAYAERLAAALR